MFGADPLDKVPLRWFKKELEVRRGQDPAAPVGEGASSGESLTCVEAFDILLIGSFLSSVLGCILSLVFNGSRWV